MPELKEGCPHCGKAEMSDLHISSAVICIEGEDPEAKELVYCSYCGHVGDLDTWNNRP